MIQLNGTSELLSFDGLKKDIDDRLNIFLGKGKSRIEGAETELRYSLEDNKYLKLKMDKDKTILGLEKRKEF